MKEDPKHKNRCDLWWLGPLTVLGIVDSRAYTTSNAPFMETFSSYSVSLVKRHTFCLPHVFLTFSLMWPHCNYP